MLRIQPDESKYGFIIDRPVNAVVIAFSGVYVLDVLLKTGPGGWLSTRTFTGHGRTMENHKTKRMFLDEADVIAWIDCYTEKDCLFFWVQPQKTS